MKNYLTILLISTGLTFVACSSTSPSITTVDVKKEAPEENDIPPACRTAQLAPLLKCGKYVIVKGKLNSSNNLERFNGTTMYLSSSLDKKLKSKDLENKNVLLSGQCSCDQIEGISIMLYLKDTKLLQIIEGKNIDKNNTLQTCQELKEISLDKEGKK